MICPSCNTPNRDDAKFCKKCGQAIHARTSMVPEAAHVSQNSAPVQEDTNAVDDISLAPTQIIAPQQMMAFHASRWQKDQEREQTSAQTTTKDQAASDNAAPAQQSVLPAQSSEMSPGVDVADIPTVLINSSASNEPSSPASDAEAIPIPPPPPVVEVVAQAAEKPGAPPEEDKAVPPVEPPPTAGGDTALKEKADTEAAAQANTLADATPATPATAKEEDDGVTQTQAEQPEQSGQPEQTEQPTPTSDFPVLAVGTTLIGRYEITQLISEGAQEHVYEVIDHQGYQHCWNCNSEQNREGDEFCIDCGAELLNASYNMHEYPATESHDTEASVLQGAIMNTFVDQERTYVIEQEQATENAFPNGVHLIAACDSDAGNVRRSEPNEDSTLVLMLQRVHESRSMPAGVFIVADGLGGHDNGQLASRMTINIIAERMVRELLAAPLANEKAGSPAGATSSAESKETPTKLDEDALVSLLQGAVEDANTAICQENQRDKTDMGSTITGFMVVGDYAYILNVGDSRTYMLRGEQIYQLTTDHSLVGQLVAGGLIQPDDVYTHPQRSQIFRSLGDKLNVQIDIFKQQLHPGDILLSCSDGLWEMVRNPQIESILNNAPDPQIACTQLLEAANTNGGEDNVSAVVVFVH